MLRKLLLLVVILSAANIFAATYYVDNTAGNDANSGTSTSSPWKSISKVNAKTFAPGDNILFKRGSTWSGTTLNMTSSGTSTAPIVYGSYGTGNLPVIDGLRTLSSVAYNSGKSYVTIQEIKFQNATGEGTVRIQSSTGCIVKNCEFYVTAHGAVFLQNNTNTLIMNNDITTYVGDLNIQTDGIYIQRNNGTIIDGNHIIVSNTNTSQHCDGIQSYQDANVTVRNNYIEQANQKTYNAQGIYQTEGTGVQVYYNNVVKCPYTKSSTLGYQNLTTNGTTRSYNNTLITGGTNGLSITGDPGAVAKNNIIIGLGSNPPVTFTVKPAVGNLNNNIYYGTTSTIMYMAGTVYTFAQLKAMGYESAGKNVNPMLNSDYTEQSGSPAVDAGANLSTLFTTDKMGTARPQGNGWDIGAYEYKTTTITPPTTGSPIALYAYKGTISGNAGTKTVAGSKGAQILWIGDNTGISKYTVTVPTTGTYYIWGRFYYDFSYASGCNSFYVNFDAGAKMTFGNKEVYRTWHWDGNNGALVSAYLTAGTHTITISNRETSTLLYLDMMVLSNNPSYVPTDSQFGLGKDGDNASVETVPGSYELAQNFPNPFNPSTVIRYTIPQNTEVSVKVYNILGQQVADLFNGMQNAGTYQLSFDGSNLASGTYIYMIKTKDFTESKKMQLLK